MGAQGNQDWAEGEGKRAAATTEASARPTGAWTALQRQEYWVFKLPTLASHWMQDASSRGPNFGQGSTLWPKAILGQGFSCKPPAGRAPGSGGMTPRSWSKIWTVDENVGLQGKALVGLLLKKHSCSSEELPGNQALASPPVSQ